MNTNPTLAPIAPPGLKGLVVADTSIGAVRGAEGFYHYRQHDAVAIARQHSLEAAAFLLLDGHIPTDAEETALRAHLATGRRLPPGSIDFAALTGANENGNGQSGDGQSSHVDFLAALRAALSSTADNTPTLDLSPDQRRERGLAAAAKVPTILAACYRTKAGLTPIEPDPALSHAADYARMLSGTTLRPELLRALETYLVLTLDHGFNASTFTARVVASTGASMSSSLVAAIGALSGPLHGGAPSRVLDMLNEIGDPANTEAWASSQLDSGHKVMGFGHAVYRADDPRSTLLKQTALALGGDLVERAVEIESRMLGLFRQRKPDAVIATNVEYYAALVLDLAGIPQEMFTPTFATSRVLGWTAHILEQTANNKIMRPSARYVGPTPTAAAASA